MAHKWYNYTGSLSEARIVLAQNKHPYANLSNEDLVYRLAHRVDHANDAIQFVCEGNWAYHNRPYYNVWPCIGEALAKTSLAFDCEYLVKGAVSLKQSYGIDSCICLRWAKGHELDGIVKSLLTAIRPVTNLEGVPIEIEFWVFVDAGEIREGRTVYWTRSVKLLDNMTVEGVIKYFGRPEDYTDREYITIQRAFTVAAAVWLMASQGDADFITPVPEQEIEDSYRLSHKQKKAGNKRKPKLAFDVGRHVEFSPHVRRPHFGLRWTEKGRRVPKIVPIKGCIVRRNKMTDVPTGFLDADDH